MRRHLPYLIAFGLLLLAAGVADAATTANFTPLTTKFVPLADLNASGGSRLAGLYASGTLADYLNKIFQFAIVIGAIAAVLRLMYAGYLYMGSADMWSNKRRAKEVIGDVTLGLLLLLTVWLILSQINPDILKLDALRGIVPAGQTSGGTTNGNASTYQGVPAGTLNANGFNQDQARNPI